MHLDLTRLLLDVDATHLILTCLPRPSGAWLVLSHPLSAPSLSLPAALTAAEREVAALVLRGLSSAEIARRRQSALRTVSNQLAAIFRKCGVRSRFELAAQVARPGGVAP